MKLDILQNSQSIKLADDNLFNLLFKHFTNLGKYDVNYEFFNGLKLQNFSEKSDIYYLKEKKIWFSHISEYNRFLYAFGVDFPKKNDLNIPIFVIDFSNNGISKNVLTAFAVDDNSDVFILLRVNYNNLRDSLRGFWNLSERIQATEIDEKKYFINLGQIDEPDFLEKFTKIIEDMAEIKNLKIDSNKELSNNKKKYPYELL